MDSQIDSCSIGPSRTAAIARYGEENIGVCIYLTVNQLRDLGIEPAETETISYQLIQFDELCVINLQSDSDSPSPEATDSMTD